MNLLAPKSFKTEYVDGYLWVTNVFLEFKATELGIPTMAEGKPGSQSASGVIGSVNCS